MEELFKAFAADYPATLKVLSIVGTPFVAAVVALVASAIQYNQWRTARDKLRLDLFDKRMEIYNQLSMFVERQMHKERFTPEEMAAFERSMNSAQFIFGRETSAYIATLKSHLGEFRRAFVRWKDQEKEGGLVSEDQMQTAAEMTRAEAAFHDQWRRADAYFLRYLNFAHIRR
jgi:hypothetical protein